MGRLFKIKFRFIGDINLCGWIEVADGRKNRQRRIEFVGQLGYLSLIARSQRLNMSLIQASSIFLKAAGESTKSHSSHRIPLLFLDMIIYCLVSYVNHFIDVAADFSESRVVLPATGRDEDGGSFVRLPDQPDQDVALAGEG